MWIDSDAIFINHEYKIEEFIARAGGRELIIAEDSSKCCLINAGVILVRICEWSKNLWKDVWAMKKYFSCFFYEQSALVRCLHQRFEGLEDIIPFHSFSKGGSTVDKFFPHVLVLTCVDFNSNKCSGIILDSDLEDAGSEIKRAY